MSLRILHPSPAATVMTGAPKSSRPRIRLVRRTFADLVGRTLSKRYLLDEILGRGGVGNVYAATDLETGCDVAIKELSSAALSSNNLRRFRLEAESASALRHKNVCRVDHLGVAYGIPYIVMERLHGQTLRRRLSQERRLPIGETVSIMLQLLEGLQAAHERFVIHRDVKPGNIFLVDSDASTPQVKLIDFGLARIFTPSVGEALAESTAITETDSIPGTPQYLTPEQLAGSRDLDARVDVWAAGLTMFEMLVGRRLYEGETFPDLARRIVTRDVPSVRAERPEVPRELEALLVTALAKNRDQRFTSASAFHAALVDAWARCCVRGLAAARAIY